MTPTQRFLAAAKALKDEIAEGRRQAAQRALERHSGRLVPTLWSEERPREDRMPSVQPPYHLDAVREPGRQYGRHDEPPGRGRHGYDGDVPTMGRADIEPSAQPAAAAPTLTPMEGLYEAAKALRESIHEGIRASEARLAAVGVTAVARHAPLAGAMLQQAPTPGRIRALAENPEKALVAGAAAVVSAVTPAAAPVAATAAKVVEKLIDQSRDLDLDGPTR
jgi:hypothetical protein